MYTLYYPLSGQTSGEYESQKEAEQDASYDVCGDLFTNYEDWLDNGPIVQPKESEEDRYYLVAIYEHAIETIDTFETLHEADNHLKWLANGNADPDCLRIELCDLHTEYPIDWEWVQES